MFKSIFLILLAVFSAIHLYASWHNNKPLRNKTKPFLLIFILAYYLTATTHYNSFLIAALLASWLGDVLLMPHGHKWFVAGGISFMISHVFFILVYVHRINMAKILWLIVIPVAILYYAIGYKIITAVKDNTPKMMILPMYFYLICNGTQNTFALMQMFESVSPGSVIAFIGAVLFFVSDCLLFLVRYHKNTELIFKKHFLVMLTYILGEFLITIGILLLEGAALI